MIRETEQPPRETIPEPMLAAYRLDDSPRRREAGSLLFAATAPDGSPATLQVSADPVTSRRTRARFRRLARARAEVAHPALLGVREVGEADGRVYAGAEPFPARSLADLLHHGPLEPALALRLLGAVADGLDAAHAAGVVHRTLSAESILLDGDHVKLDLFGIFTVVGQAGWGDVVRRDPHLHYEPPEGVRGDELSPASNVYSLTGLLVHALTGEQPFAHHDPVMITYAHLSQPPPKPSERNPELPSGLDAIVARGMAKDPGERPESATALVAAAARVLRATPKPATGGEAAPQSAIAARVLRATSKPATGGEARPPLPAPAAPTAPAPRAPAPVAPTRGTPAPAAPAPVAPARPTPAPAAPAPTAPTRPTPAPAALAPAPVAPVPAAPVPRAPVDGEPPLRPRVPLRAWLVPLGPVLLVILVAGLFGALLGTPGSGSEQAASTAKSPEQAAVERLDGVRFRLRDDLAFAATADEQADAAQRLAMAYGRAADHLTSPALVSAAQEASAAYVAMETAARSADQDSYDDARARVEEAEKRIDSELARIDRSRAAE
jgi:Protein kinase domain